MKQFNYQYLVHNSNNNNNSTCSNQYLSMLILIAHHHHQPTTGISINKIWITCITSPGTLAIQLLYADVMTSHANRRSAT